MNLNPFKGANLDDIELYLSRKLQEWLSRLAQMAQDRWTRFREKGREHLTVMMIPHSERKIFNFHISFFAISAWIGGLIVVIAVASVIIIDHSSTVKGVDILIDNKQDSKRLISEFRKETRRLRSLFNRFKPEIIGLYAMTSGSKDKAVELFGGMGGPEEPIDQSKIKRDEAGELDDFPDEVDHIDNLQKELQVAAKAVDEVKDYLKSRKKIIRNTPSVWPTDGYVYSLYGKRVNPYRGTIEKNSGIDIVAKPGAQIRATAPGKIVFAGWDDKLGLTVRIKHKYGYKTTYGYNQRILVKVGQRVAKNEVIGFVGRTGYATRYVCHYRIKIGTLFVDPMPYLNRIRIN